MRHLYWWVLYCLYSFLVPVVWHLQAKVFPTGNYLLLRNIKQFRYEIRQSNSNFVFDGYLQKCCLFIEQLKFENKWEWADPPTFAGVYRDNVEIFFSTEEQGPPITWLSLVVDNVDEYFGLIKDSGAKILSKPENKEWNMREMLVECPDGTSSYLDIIRLVTRLSRMDKKGTRNQEGNLFK